MKQLEPQRKKRENLTIVAIIAAIIIAILIFLNTRPTKTSDSKATISQNNANQQMPPSKGSIGHPSSGHQSTTEHKSNLDWIHYDNTPNDSIDEYYKIERDGATKNYHYTIKINYNDNTITLLREWFKNEWNSFEGGRITGNYSPATEIKWNENEKTSGEFSIRDGDIFSFEIKDGSLRIETGTTDSFNYAGNYEKAYPNESESGIIK